MVPSAAGDGDDAAHATAAVDRAASSTSPPPPVAPATGSVPPSQQQPQQQLAALLRTSTLETPAVVRTAKLSHLTERLNAVSEAARQLSSDSKAKEAFLALSRFYVGDSAEGRGTVAAETPKFDCSKLPSSSYGLRSLLLQRKKEAVHCAALRRYGAVQAHLLDLLQQVLQLNSDVTASLDALAKCKVRCADVIAAAQTLQRNRQNVQAKQLVACQMIELLHVPETAVNALAGALPPAPPTSSEAATDPGQQALHTLATRLLPAFEQLARVERNAQGLRDFVQRVGAQRRAGAGAVAAAGDSGDSLPEDPEMMAPATPSATAVSRRSSSGASAATSAPPVDGTTNAKNLHNQLDYDEIASSLSCVAADESLARVEDLRVIGFERLAAAVQRIVRHVKDFAEKGTLPMSPATAVSQSLTLLKANHQLYTGAITDVLKSRRAQMTQKFEHCLIVGVPANDGGYSIQLSSFELPRYIGDMLCFVHESAPLALAFLRDVLGLSDEEKGDMEGIPSVPQAFDFVFGAVADQIEARTQKALAEADCSPSLVCRAEQVIAFYASAFASITPRELRVADMCHKQRQQAHELFLDAWEKQTMLLSTVAAADDETRTVDLGTPPYLSRHLASLAEVLAVYEGAEQLHGVVETSELDRILSSAVTPLLNVCRQTARTLAPLKAAIYLVNCYHFTMTAIASYPSADTYAQLCQSLLDEQREIVRNLMADTALRESGLQEKLDALRHWSSQPPEMQERLPISSVSTLHPMSMSACLRGFYNKLFSPTGIPPPEIEKISSRAIRNDTKMFVLTQVIEAYAELHDSVAPTGVATHSPAQIRELLGL